MLRPMTTPRNEVFAKWPWIFAAIIGLSGISISFLLARTRRIAEEKEAEQSFRNEARNLQAAVSQEVQLFTDVLGSLRQLHSISDQISALDFGEFVEKGLIYQRRILGSFGFAQRVDPDTRVLLEQADASSTNSGLTVLEGDGAGHFRRSRDQEEYFPLTYQKPDQGLGVPNGFDFGCDMACRSAIGHMSITGLPALGGPAYGSTNSWYIFSPILYPTFNGIPAAPPGYIVGCVVSVFRPDVILSRVTGDPGPQDLRIELSNPPTAMAEGPRPAVGLAFEAPVQVADQAWVFRCVAGAGYLQSHRTRWPTVLFLTGFLITALLTVELMLMANRSRRIEQVVRSRTAALSEAKAQLEQEMTQRLNLEKEILEIGGREKLRVGQDLHDSLGQKLTGAVFLSRALADRLSTATPEERESAEHINALLKETLGQVRRIARGLAPVELGDEGLANALNRMAEEVHEMFGISCAVYEAPDARTPGGSAAVHLYHIAQEAANNAARHGKAQHLRIALSDGVLSIEDDGSGIPADTERGRGMGLQIMRYRAAMIGGQLEVHRRPEGGTAVVCRFQTESRGP